MQDERKNKMTKNRKIWLGVLCFVTLLWTAFIFSRSLQTGEESSAASGRLTALIQALLGGLPVSEYFVRKLAHFTEYALLSLPAAGAALLVGRRWVFAAWSYAILVALCDEFVVQAMTVGRGPRFSDVLIDGAGALVGAVMLMVVWLLARRWSGKTL